MYFRHTEQVNSWEDGQNQAKVSRMIDLENKIK